MKGGNYDWNCQKKTKQEHNKVVITKYKKEIKLIEETIIEIRKS